MWQYTDCGSGRPLVLLHGLGMSSAAWNPVLPHLLAAHRVIAFDIAGFGRTPPLASGIAPTVPHLVDALADSLRGLGVTAPVDIAGNSLGGWMALEAARRGLARTVLAISPAGLWERRPPVHVAPLFRALRCGARRFPRFLKSLVAIDPLRELVLAVPISTGSRRMLVTDARRIIDDLGRAVAFEDTFEHTQAPFVGRDIQGPVTVAVGARDRIITRSARSHGALPPHTRWLEPSGWGHVPMWADPVGVAALILDCAACESVLQ